MAPSSRSFCSARAVTIRTRALSAYERSRAKSETGRRFLELATRHALVRSGNAGAGTRGSRSDPAAHARPTPRGRAAERDARACSSPASSCRAVNAMTAFGADPMPFKGPTLAVLAYGSLSLRQYEDLDILVRRQEVERARKALLSLGYEPVNPYSDNQRASLRLAGHHEQLVNPATGATIELHWSLNNRSLTHDSFEHHWWENRQHVAIGGVDMRTLGVEQMLLYLCMHGGKHSWGRLSWLCDFQRALRAYPNAYWSRVWALARENGAARMVEIALLLVDSLLDGGVLTAPAAQGRTANAEAKEISAVIARRLRRGHGRQARARLPRAASLARTAPRSHALHMARAGDSASGGRRAARAAPRIARRLLHFSSCTSPAQASHTARPPCPRDVIDAPFGRATAFSNSPTDTHEPHSHRARITDRASRRTGRLPSAQADERRDSGQYARDAASRRLGKGRSVAQSGAERRVLRSG